MDSRLRNPKSVFECYVEISRPKNGEDAKVSYIFPKNYEWDDDTRKQLPKFTFPNNVCNDSEEHFTFVLTDLDGKYRFGFCRYPPKGDSCMCFLSDMPLYKVFYRAMDKISDMRLDHQRECVEPLLGALRSHEIPNLGSDSLLSVIPDGVESGQVFTFPLPNPKKLSEIPTDHNLTQFYTSLHHNVILHLFANMLFERRIIITSKSLSLLSACIHGAVTLLYPLHWQHIFIPITPPHLIDYCAAPMPFLMGVHSSMMEQVHRMPTDEVVILDVDESTIESPHCEDLLMLPPDVVTTLKHIMKKQSSAYGDTVTKAFMLAQVSMIGGYRSALKLRAGEKEVVFDEDLFLKSRPNMEEFLENLLHFQHFRQFINGRIHKLKNQSTERDLFDHEVLMFEEELKGTTQEQVKAAFDKFISSTVVNSKRLWDSTKEGGHKLGKAMQNYKVVDKGWKSTKNWMKETKRQLQGKDKEKIVPSDYAGRTIENTALLDQLSEDRKAHTLPDLRRTPPTATKLPHDVPFSGTGSSSTQPKIRDRGKAAPSVIPYHRHVEGKRKLAESLRQSGITTPSDSSSDVAVGILLSFTPPDTPKANQNPEQSSLDRYDRASLDSKESIEITVTSREVVTGNLLDLSSSGGGSNKQLQSSAWGNGDDDDKDSSRSESVASTTSSSGAISQEWEKFDDDDESRPPLPPPRSELKHLFSSESKNSALSPIEAPTKESLNPFESNTGRTSPIDGFSSSIAQTLFDSSKRRSDPFAASALATMSMDIFKTVAETTDFDLPDPLIPTSSVGSATINVPTSSFPTVRSSPQFFSHSTGNVHKLGISNGGSNLGFMSQINSGSTPNLYVIQNVQAQDTIGKSTSAGNSPSVSPKPSFNGQHLKRPPPPKPQPYSGGAMALYEQAKESPGRPRAHAMLKVAHSDCSSLDYDPFGGLFGNEGLTGYARRNSTSLSPQHNSPTKTDTTKC